MFYFGGVFWRRVCSSILWHGSEFRFEVWYFHRPFQGYPTRLTTDGAPIPLPLLILFFSRAFMMMAYLYNFLRNDVSALVLIGGLGN